MSSAAVGLAPSPATIVIARLAQGASAGLLTPQNSGLIQQLFRGDERGRAFGMFGFTVAIASATGPLIGGALIALLGEENGWRSLFLVNVPIGLVALVMIRRLVPDNVDAADRDPRIDLPGALLLGLTVLAVLYPLISLEAGAGLPLLLLLAAPPLAWAFVRWEQRTVGRGPPAAARRVAAPYAARLRQRAGGRHALLHRLHRHLPGALGPPAGGRRLLAAPHRAAAHAVRLRRGDHLAAGRPAGRRGSAAGSRCWRWR